MTGRCDGAIMTGERREAGQRHHGGEQESNSLVVTGQQKLRRGGSVGRADCDIPASSAQLVGSL
jgi:hypothetical protein